MNTYQRKMNGYSHSKHADMNALINQYFHEYVQIAQDEAKENNKIAFSNVEKILEYVHRQDPRFGKDPIRVGSYWQGLKVDKADEYDYSIPIVGIGQLQWVSSKQRYYGFEELPTDTLRQYLEIVDMDVPLPDPPTSYCYTHVTPPRTWNQSDDIMRQGDIVPYLVRRRLKELLTDAKRDLNLRGSVRQSRKFHGPAVTVYFTVGEKEIAVDFAPVIQSRSPFQSWLGWPRRTQWPSQEKIERIKRIGINDVAKKDFYWMYTFAEAEKELVSGIDIDGGKRKEVHRVMKKLNQDVWCNTTKPVISSYILKNIWFWEIERYPAAYHWGNDQLWTRLENMTRTLLGCLRDRKLKQYFYPDVNLMASKDTDELDIAAEKVQTFLEEPRRYLEVDEE